jgi:hypothetical protein
VNGGRLSHSLPQAANGRFATLISEVPLAGFSRLLPVRSQLPVSTAIDPLRPATNGGYVAIDKGEPDTGEMAVGSRIGKSS